MSGAAKAAPLLKMRGSSIDMPCIFVHLKIPSILCKKMHASKARIFVQYRRFRTSISPKKNQRIDAIRRNPAFCQDPIERFGTRWYNNAIKRTPNRTGADLELIPRKPFANTYIRYKPRKILYRTLQAHLSRIVTAKRLMHSCFCKKCTAHTAQRRSARLHRL